MSVTESSDEKRRKAEKPVVSIRAALELVEKYWGYKQSSFTQVRVLESYDDCNFFVEAGSKRMLFKCHNGVETDNRKILDAQTAMTSLLAKRGVRTQKAIPALNGDIIIEAEVPVTGGYNRLVGLRVFEWVEGKPLVGIATPNLIFEWGQTLGRVQSVLTEEAFDHEGLHRYHQWDLRNTSDLRTFLKCITDERRRGIVESVIDTFEAKKSEMDATLKMCALQADFNDANLILGEDGVLGVIDFGDIVHSWSVCEIAIGAAYATVSSYGQENPLGAAASLLRGVSKTQQLTEAEMKYLRLLAACRLAISVTLGAYSYQLQPECTYLLLHSEPGWKSLDALWVSSGEDAINELFQNALGKDVSLDELQVQGLGLASTSRKKARAD